MGVNLTQFIKDLKDCLGWPYKSPGSIEEDASTGIDCSGMISRAFKLQGYSIYHGSNTIWRSYCTGKQVYNKNKLKPGMVVFKHRNDGKEPVKYRGDGQGNFYHIGISCGTIPTEIIDSSGGGVKMGRTGWTHMAYLTKVDYDSEKSEESKKEEVNPVEGECYVNTPNGGTVNIRKSASTSATILDKIPNRSKVKVIEDDGTWCKVTISREGFIMKKFLEQGGNDNGV